MKRKLCALLMTAILLAGCSGTAAPTPTPTAADEGTGETPAPSETPASFDVNTVEEFNVLALGGLSNDLTDMDDIVGKEITKKTGVRLNFEFPVGDWSEKLALVIAGDDYPDLIVNKVSAISQLVDAGALVGLKEKIDNNAPNIVNYLGDKIGRLTYSLDNPEYYGFGDAQLINDSKPDEYWAPGYALQHDVVIQAGFPKITSLQEYENLIADYKAKNPEINGQPSIGISLVAADGWRWKISVTNPAFLVNGKPDDGEWYIDPETYQAQFHYKDPAEKEYFRWLNHLNDVGLLDPESFTQSYDAYQAKVASGRVIGLIDALWEYDIARRQARENVGEERDYIVFPILTDPANMVWSAERSDGKVSAGGYMVTKACKNVDKIVNFFDYLATEEAQILRKWGIEGEHYDIIDGQRVTKPEIKEIKLNPEKTLEFRKSSGIGRYNEGALYMPGYGYKTSNGQILDDYDDQEKWDSYTASQKKVLEGYGVRGFTQLFPAPSDIPESPFGAAWTLALGQTEESKVISGKIEEIIPKGVARAVLAKPDQFDAEWDKFLKEVEDVNVAYLEEEVTNLVAERMELWGSK